MIKFIALALGFLTLCGPAFARHDGSCHGQDRERSISLIQTAWQAGVEIGIEIGLTQDFNRGMLKLIAVSQQMNEAAQQLPPSCQMLIAQWSKAISGAVGGGGGGGGSQCMGGVCCDQSGCYGN